MIAYGKMAVLDEKAELNVELRELKPQGDYLCSELSKEEHLLVCQL